MRAKSQRQLAQAVRVSQAAVSGWTRRPDWPFARRGPWDVAKVKSWAANLQENRAADGDAGGKSGKVTTALRRERMLHERLKRKRLEGTLVERRLLDAALEELAKLFV